MPENINVNSNSNDVDINDQQAYSSGLTYNQWYNFVCGLLTGRGALRKKPSRGNTGKTTITPPIIIPTPIIPGDEPIDVPTVKPQRPSLPSLPTEIDTRFRGRIKISDYQLIGEDVDPADADTWWAQNNGFRVHVYMEAINETEQPITISMAVLKSVRARMYFRGSDRIVEMTRPSDDPEIPWYANSYIDEYTTIGKDNDRGECLVQGIVNMDAVDGLNPTSVFSNLWIEFNPTTLPVDDGHKHWLPILDFDLVVSNMPTRRIITQDGQETIYYLSGYEDYGIIAANKRNYGGASSPYDVDSFILGSDVGMTENILGPIDWTMWGEAAAEGFSKGRSDYFNYSIKIDPLYHPHIAISPSSPWSISGSQNVDDGLIPPDFTNLSYIYVKTTVTQEEGGNITFNYGPDGTTQYVPSGTNTIRVTIPIINGEGAGYSLEIESENDDTVLTNTIIETSQSPLIPVIKVVEKAFDDFGSLVDDIMLKLEVAGGPIDLNIDEVGNLTDDVLIRLKTPLNPNWLHEEAASLTDDVQVLLKSTKIRKNFEDVATLTDSVIMFNKSSRIKQSVNEAASLTDEVLINI